MTDAARVVETLRAGGIVLLPTDTVYGLAVHPEHGAGSLRPVVRDEAPATVPQPADHGRGGRSRPRRWARTSRRRPGGCWPRSPPAAHAGPRRRPRGGAGLAGRPGRDRDPDPGRRAAAGGAAHGRPAAGDQREPARAGDAGVHAAGADQLDGEPDLALDGGVRPTVPSTLVNCNLPARRSSGSARSRPSRSRRCWRANALHLVLGVETSCDDTSVALVDPAGTVLAASTASQVALHNRYGGVYPEMASRAHVDKILPTVRMVLEDSGVDPRSCARSG